MLTWEKKAIDLYQLEEVAALSNSGEIVCTGTGPTLDTRTKVIRTATIRAQEGKVECRFSIKNKEWDLQDWTFIRNVADKYIEVSAKAEVEKGLGAK